MKMRFQPQEKVVEFHSGISVLDLAIAHKLPLNHSCGGMGSCGTCRVKVTSSLEELPPRNPVEAELAAARGLREYERLACQTRAFDGLCVEIPNPKSSP